MTTETSDQVVVLVRAAIGAVQSGNRADIAAAYEGLAPLEPDDVIEELTLWVDDLKAAGSMPDLLETVELPTPPRSADILQAVAGRDIGALQVAVGSESHEKVLASLLVLVAALTEAHDRLVAEMVAGQDDDGSLSGPEPETTAVSRTEKLKAAFTADRTRILLRAAGGVAALVGLYFGVVWVWAQYLDWWANAGGFGHFMVWLLVVGFVIAMIARLAGASWGWTIALAFGLPLVVALLLLRGGAQMVGASLRMSD